MKSEQAEIYSVLRFKVIYLPGSFDKRLGMLLNSLNKLKKKQNEQMYRLLYKYRRQIPEVYNKYKNNPFCSKKIKRP